MNSPAKQPCNAPPVGEGLAKTLRAAITGEVRFDDLTRTIYATDASIYEIIPRGVVFPRGVADVVATVKACRDGGVALVPRGAGTGLTGGAIGTGVALDLSRYLDRIGSLDVEARTVEVEPGVVLDDLNRHLAAHGLQFGPDVATSNRATIGGMIANNSCGARSIVYGRTVDHVLELTVVLADADVVTFAAEAPAADAKNSAPQRRAAEIEARLGRIRDTYHSEIQERFPQVLRSNAGYGLDRLGAPGTPTSAIPLLCGSEGTLGIVVGAKLNLVPLVRHQGLVILHFDDLLSALEIIPAILQHSCAAVELVDRLILEAGRLNVALSKHCDFLQGDPAALLVVEFLDDDAGAMVAKMGRLAADREVSARAFAAVPVPEAERQAHVWNLRKSGLGLLMSQPGDRQPHAFVEDTAVHPARLREYIERVSTSLKDEGVDAGYYAHASAGCLHIRPVLNLKDGADVERMGRIADLVSDLVLEFGGTMTGEHGDGIVRSCWLEKLYGPAIVEAFREVKELFDPAGLLNPHKIVDPWPMTDHLRYGAGFQSRAVKTHLDFSAYGGMAGLAEMCSGVGACRQRLMGTMCPSYQATRDEQHTTRARANALRVALSNRGLLEGLDDPQLAEVMDLCLSCKACKTECPTGVDIARLKAEYLSRRNQMLGVPPGARLVADLPHLARLASWFPRISNFVARSGPVRAFVERRYGFDRRIPLPRFAHQTFRAWYRGHVRKTPPAVARRGNVIYFVDTWANYFVPQVGIAAVKVLERAGFNVLCPETVCCGRPAISKGLLTEAKQLADQNVLTLARLTRSGVPVIGTEPSCILTLTDEYPQLVRTQAARRIAAQTVMIETFLRRLLDTDPNALGPLKRETLIRYHGHCHQKALIGSEDALALLRHFGAEESSEIDSGCCGMAGAFGHEKDHYDVARAIGEERLFPAVRNRGEASIAISGFSCRHQVEHHTGAPVKHLIEYLADALD